MTRFALFFVLIPLVSPVLGQLMDTTYLDEVRIYGLPVTAYATGSKVEHISSGDEVSNASDKLIAETPFYFKTYGNNQLSTIALRGTTASQTAVLWNGMNINSPTLGQTDFSLIPLFLFDDVSVRYGSVSALYGSDAIGGSILIGQQKATFKKNFRGTFYQQAGSFGRFSTGIKAIYGNERWEFRTKIFRTQLENDFPYESPAVGYAKRQNNASVTNYGFDQQVHLKISEMQQISAEGMYTYNFREIQPAVTNDNADETLLDRHVRLSLNYQNDSRLGILSATMGYIFSDQDYTNDVVSTVQSKQFTSMLSMDRSLNQRSNLRYGLSYSHYSALSENYVSDVSENRYDAFLSYRHALKPFWIVNVNARQSFYADSYAPFAPSLGTEIHLLRADEKKLQLRAQAGRGFRIPTLNDRYWIPGGNPAVAPEDAMHIEGGVNLYRKVNAWTYSVDGAIYKTWINNMIVWTPEGNVWSPANLQKVDAHGVELTANTTFTGKKFLFKGNVMYSLARSLNKGEQDMSLHNKQLAYVPVHSARAAASASVNNWSLDLRLKVTGMRYVTLDNEKSQALNTYALLDASLRKRFNWEKIVVDLRADANNLLDLYYENLKNHAMPGRNYSVSVLLNFNNKSTL